MNSLIAPDSGAAVELGRFIRQQIAKHPAVESTGIEERPTDECKVWALTAQGEVTITVFSGGPVPASAKGHDYRALDQAILQAVQDGCERRHSIAARVGSLVGMAWNGHNRTPERILDSRLQMLKRKGRIRQRRNGHGWVPTENQPSQEKHR